MGQAREQLYNSSQIRAQKSCFLHIKWHTKKETLPQFGENVQSQGLSLGVDNGLISATFINGLPVKLQTFAHTSTGSYDDVVNAVDNVSKSMRKGNRSDETIGEVREGSSS